MRKILAIDGGGIKGVFPAAFLASIEEKIAGNIGDYFDLIVGTSTGGIIALGLALGMSAKEILQFYEQDGPLIFGKETRRKWFKQVVVSKYTPDALQYALEKHFKEKLVGECKTRVVIPSQNMLNGKIHIFKTAHHERFETDFRKKVVEVARATTAAPVYFPTHQNDQGIPFVDGGLGANNPIGLAVVEAIGVLNWEASNLKILSLGCTTEPFSVKYGDNGLAGWAGGLVDTFMAAQSYHSYGTAVLLAGHENVFRISPMVPNNKFSLDGAEGIGELKAFGELESREEFPKLKKVFFNEIAEPFVPVYSL